MGLNFSNHWKRGKNGDVKRVLENRKGLKEMAKNITS